MPRLSKSQLIAREQIARAAAEALLPEALVARVSAALLAAIPCDGFRFFGIDPDTLLVNRLFGAGESDGWARIEWRLNNVYEKRDVRGRSELLARLFRETRLPGLIAAERAAPRPTRLPTTSPALPQSSRQDRLAGQRDRW